MKHVLHALRKGIAAALGVLFTAASLAAGAAEHAHVHGVARLDVAIERERLTVQLSSPLDNLMGFEHAPRNADERKRADAAIAALRDAGRLLRPDPAGGCTLDHVELDSAALKLGHPDPHEEAEGHADIDATFEFHCNAGERVATFDVSGLWTFARLQKLEIQVAAPNGQFRRDLQRPQGVIRVGR
jgi:hypothetical protein